jgi:hypothetical protein
MVLRVVLCRLSRGSMVAVPWCRFMVESARVFTGRAHDGGCCNPAVVLVDTVARNAPLGSTRHSVSQNDRL